jgi:hypothetical protein
MGKDKFGRTEAVCGVGVQYAQRTEAGTPCRENALAGIFDSQALFGRQPLLKGKGLCLFLCLLLTGRVGLALLGIFRSDKKLEIAFNPVALQECFYFGPQGARDDPSYDRTWDGLKKAQCFFKRAYPYGGKFGVAISLFCHQVLDQSFAWAIRPVAQQCLESALVVKP